MIIIIITGGSNRVGLYSDDATCECERDRYTFFVDLIFHNFIIYFSQIWGWWTPNTPLGDYSWVLRVICTSHRGNRLWFDSRFIYLQPPPNFTEHPQTGRDPYQIILSRSLDLPGHGLSTLLTEYAFSSSFSLFIVRMAFNWRFSLLPVHFSTVVLYLRLPNDHWLVYLLK